MSHSAALKAEYASQTSVLDEEARKMIASGEAILKIPGHTLLAQMGIIPPPTPTTTQNPHSTSHAESKIGTQSKPFSLLDNACGPGLIAGVLQENMDREVLSQSRILCADVSANFVAVCKQRAEEAGWVSVETAVLDAQDPGLPDSSFDYSTINFAMHIIPDPDAVLKTTKALLKPSGVLGLTTMHSSSTGWSPDLVAALNSLSSPSSSPESSSTTTKTPILSNPPPQIPAQIPMTPNNRPEWAETAGVRSALEAHGFEDIQVNLLPHKSPVASGADAVEKFAMMIRMVGRAYWGEGTMRRVNEELLAKQEAEQQEGGRLEEDKYGKAGTGLMGYVQKLMDEWHGGEAWELDWVMLLATARKPGSE